jgi:hypothetical protein
MEQYDFVNVSASLNVLNNFFYICHWRIVFDIKELIDCVVVSELT